MISNISYGMLIIPVHNRRVHGSLPCVFPGVTRMKSLLLAFIEDTRGATAIEYALIGALLSTVIVAALLQIGPAIESQFEQVNAGFDQ